MSDRFFLSSANMLAKSTRRSPWLVGIWAEVARLQSVIALRAAPRRGSSFPQEDACIGGEGLSFYYNGE
jgi:hypothetical protein